MPPLPFSNIQFGDGLSVTDLGSGSIRVDAGGAGLGVTQIQAFGAASTNVPAGGSANLQWSPVSVGDNLVTVDPGSSEFATFNEEGFYIIAVSIIVGSLADGKTIHAYLRWSAAGYQYFSCVGQTGLSQSFAGRTAAGKGYPTDTIHIAVYNHDTSDRTVTLQECRIYKLVPATPSGLDIACFGANGYGTINIGGLVDNNVSGSSFLAFDSTKFATNDSDTFEVHDASGSLRLKRDGFYTLWFKAHSATVNNDAYYINAQYRVWNDAESHIYNTMSGAADEPQMGAIFYGRDMFAAGSVRYPTLGSTEMYNFTDALTYPLRARLLIYSDAPTDPTNKTFTWSMGGFRFSPIPDSGPIISN